MRPVHLGVGAIKDPAVRAALVEIERASNDTLQNDNSSVGSSIATATTVDQVLAILANGGAGSAWTAYTPTISAGSGTFTSVSATGRYKQFGKTVFVEMVISITTNGTAASYVVATLPAAPASFAVLAGREGAITGKALQGVMQVATSVTILNYDNTYPGVNGGVLILSGLYESA